MHLNNFFFSFDLFFKKTFSQWHKPNICGKITDFKTKSYRKLNLKSHCKIKYVS